MMEFELQQKPAFALVRQKTPRGPWDGVAEGISGGITGVVQVRWLIMVEVLRNTENAVERSVHKRASKWRVCKDER